MKLLTVGSLFSGIGGLEYGLELTGEFKTIWQCENDLYASAVLGKHWPEVPNLGDIREVVWESVAMPDIVCGGFPCQDISVAGKGAGIENGKRSGLWFEFVRCISAARPEYVLAENVGRIQVNGIGRVCGDLSRLGYIVHPVEISANQIGAYSQRERVFFIAHSCCIGCDNCPAVDKEYEVPVDAVWGSEENIRQWSGWKRWLDKVSQAVDGQVTRADFHGMDDGIPSELDRIRCLGNAVIPQVACVIGMMILEIEKGRGFA